MGGDGVFSGIIIRGKPPIGKIIPNIKVSNLSRFIRLRVKFHQMEA
jgi:hypothetical protein